MARKTMIGVALIVIGLSIFAISHNEGLTGQENYSIFLCAVVTTTKTQWTLANNQMTGGFIGMIFRFFTALFGASLVVPLILMKLIKGNWRKNLEEEEASDNRITR